VEDIMKRRNFPRNTLEEALAAPQKIMDEMAGKPFKRLLLADSLGISPSSSNFRYLLSSAFQYGLTEGTEKASEIELTDIGQSATQNADPARRMASLREAALKPEIFGDFYNDYKDKKMPSSDMLGKILVAEYDVPQERADECAVLLTQNGRFTGIIRDIGGSPHILLDSPLLAKNETEYKGDSIPSVIPIAEDYGEANVEEPVLDRPPSLIEEGKKHRPIFIGHGKNKKPLEKLQKFLSAFQFFDEEGNEVWRPSENVVHELGASSLLYEDRIVIFKEKGLHFPSNYQSIGYIEFEVDSIDAKTADLLKELIGFGLVKVTPT
jgi:hypothetical protein